MYHNNYFKGETCSNSKLFGTPVWTAKNYHTITKMGPNSKFAFSNITGTGPYSREVTFTTVVKGENIY